MNKTQFNAFIKAIHDKKNLDKYIKDNQDEAYGFMVENVSISNDAKTYYYTDGKLPISLTEYASSEQIDWKKVAIELAGSLEKATDIANKKGLKTQKSGYFRFDTKQPKK